VDAKDNTGGRTALFVAAAGRQEGCVKLLLEHGADPDIKVSISTAEQLVDKQAASSCCLSMEPTLTLRSQYLQLSSWSTRGLLQAASRAWPQLRHHGQSINS